MSLKPQWHDVETRLINMERKLDKEGLVGYMDGKEFSLIMQDLLISEHGYVIDTGNWENVNYACVYGLIEKIKKHPILWKLFMLA